AAAVAEARDRLRLLGAIDGDDRPTDHGRAIANLPLPPRLAHMLIAGAEQGIGAIAAKVAVLVTERGLGGREADVETRLRNWDRSRDRRSEAARGLASRWARLVSAGPDNAGGDAVGMALALAFPDRVARKRGEAWLMRNGRAVRLDAADPLARHEWLAVAEASGVAEAARILLAAPIEFATVELLFGDAFATSQSVRYDPATGAVTAEESRSLGAITLARRRIEKPDPQAMMAAMLDGLRAAGLGGLPWGEGVQAFRARVAFLRAQGQELPDLSDAALLDRAEDWLMPLLAGKRRLESIDSGALAQAIETQLDWAQRQTVDRLAPSRLSTPAGTSHAIDYAAEGGPAVELRVQELFGVAEHPTVGAAHVPLTLVLLSPAHRPIQKTKDLPGFWRGSWRAVQAEMKGRYPRHPWPDDPTAATATTRTKNAAARGGPR
ncbi:MAG: ATP-dependent helicase C-terminal domain-containing protein, partial [Sphingomonadaceae bacterium]|nr:ATP-dependent helicase C-terminal domain-containing protein [Sphingomonadaceae bacterium]